MSQGTLTSFIGGARVLLRLRALPDEHEDELARICNAEHAHFLTDTKLTDTKAVIKAVISRWS